MHSCGLAHIWHAAPIVPQAALVPPATHCPPWQQPVGQLSASQTHAPAEQRRPGAHSKPAPQRHAPDVHASDLAGSHAVHADAPAPHAASDGTARHDVPVQQPEHDVASHTQLPATQC